MLIAPLWALAFVTSTLGRLIIVTIFVITFVLLLSLTVAGRTFEILAAAAAYVFPFSWL